MRPRLQMLCHGTETLHFKVNVFVKFYTSQFAWESPACVNRRERKIEAGEATGIGVTPDTRMVNYLSFVVLTAVRAVRVL